MSNKPATKKLTLAELKDEAAVARTKLEEAEQAVTAAATKANAEGASEADKKGVAKAADARAAAAQAVTDADAAVAEENALIEAQAEADAQAETLAANARASEEAEKAAQEDPDKDPKYIPVLREDGEQIPRNSKVRLRTTFNGNLRSLDGLLITPQAVAEVDGPNIRLGDWYCTQFKAGLIAVDGFKKIK